MNPSRSRRRRRPAACTRPRRRLLAAGPFLVALLPLALTTTWLLAAAAPRAAAVSAVHRTLAVGPAAVAGRMWVPPIQPLRVVRPFQPPPQPWAAGHRGVDLAALPGGPVVSAGAGTVTFAGPLAGRGVVVVRTGDLRTTYEPVAASVRVGQPVRPGDLLGKLTVPTHCDPATCLHWGLLRGSTYLDPLTLLTPPPVRLLPLDGPVVLAPAIRPGVARPAVPRGAVVGDSRVATLQVAPSGTGRGAARETSGKPRTRATPLVPVAVAALVVSVVASGGEYVWARKSGAA